ncbi:hypothetical protein K474DRAFT_1643653 [Panus rudis PR-1116 ss-1]|nr:hypothetical protein K474DRAFT_1643653 [Panus rudis PR-1116 ss-1]
MKSVNMEPDENGSRPSIAPLQIHKKANNVAPLDIKKIRRRGLRTGVQLVLPPSPLPLPRSPLAISPRTPKSSASNTPQTALTFTAEWDLTQKTFVFTPTPFESTYSPSQISPRCILSPVPDDVGLETLSVMDKPSMNGDQETQSLRSPQSRPSSPASSVSSKCSEIFDSDADGIYHARKMSSASTAPSSASPLSAKQEASESSSSLSKQITVHLFEEELSRSVPSSESERRPSLDQDLYDELDEDLLAAPMDVFERILWESTTESLSRAFDSNEQQKENTMPKRSRISYGDRIDPSIPRNASLESVTNLKPLETNSPPSTSQRRMSSPRGPRPPKKGKQRRNWSDDFLGGVFSRH